MGEPTGRVALVTGASRGIGAAIARRLAADGLDVAITYTAAADRAAAVVADVEQAGRRGIAIRADSGDPAAVRAAVATTVERLGRIDVLVNNAGVFPRGEIAEVTDDELESAWAVNVRGAYVAAQSAAAHMGTGGRIVSIGSSLVGGTWPGVSVYTMTKAALEGMTRALARELGPRGITVTLVHPGPTATDMNPEDGPNADLRRSLTALGRYQRPEEVAAAVAFLAGPGATSVTGAFLSVDAGINA